MSKTFRDTWAFLCNNVEQTQNNLEQQQQKRNGIWKMGGGVLTLGAGHAIKYNQQKSDSTCKNKSNI